MNMKMKKLAALALASTMIFSLSACGSPQAAGSSKAPDRTSADAGKGPFANMETVDLDGSQVDSSVFSGSTLTLINAWNLGCTPCIKELPALEKLNQEYAGKGVSVKGLYYNFGSELSEEERAEIAEVLDNANAQYPQLLASETMMESSELKDMAAFPTTFFVDSKGNLVDTVQGSREYEDWAALVDEMLGKAADHD